MRQILLNFNCFKKILTLSNNLRKISKTEYTRGPNHRPQYLWPFQFIEIDQIFRGNGRNDVKRDSLICGQSDRYCKECGMSKTSLSIIQLYLWGPLDLKSTSGLDNDTPMKIGLFRHANDRYYGAMHWKCFLIKLRSLKELGLLYSLLDVIVNQGRKWKK